MELRRVVWEWDSALARLQDEQPELAAPLQRSCRPLAAERRPEGQLRLVLGCWWEPDLRFLQQPANRVHLDSSLSAVLADPVRVSVEPWPGGMATAPADDAIPAPDVLKGLPTAARQEAAACESALQRHFYAEAYRKGIRQLQCQYPVLNYRLDFAVPRLHLGVEIEGWEPPAGLHGRTPRREREQHLGSEGWRIQRFWGAEVLSDVAACVDDLQRILRSIAAAGRS